MPLKTSKAHNFKDDFFIFYSQPRTHSFSPINWAGGEWRDREVRGTNGSKNGTQNKESKWNRTGVTVTVDKSTQV